jgi:hypothetical protein
MNHLPIFDALDLGKAMPELVPARANAEYLDVAASSCVGLRPELQSAIWLYVDELHRSHEISQKIAGEVGAYWHGIMHRREGDFWNSKYWFRQAKSLWAAGGEGWDPCAFVDRVESAEGKNPLDLVEMQRQEWKALFTYCAERSEST